MRRAITRSVLVGATLVMLGSACGGRSTIDWGVPPGGNGTGGVVGTGGSAGVINNGGTGGGISDGGSGGVVTTGGTGGIADGGSGGIAGAPGGNGGGGGSGPLACFQCISQKCPQIQQCIMDQTCRQGVICAVQGCLSGGGSGGIDFQCLAQCFNGDFQAAMQAFQGLQCVFSTCGSKCPNGIPGLPGGGGLPGTGGGG